MAHPTAIKTFVIVTVDGVDLTVYSEGAARKHARELKKEFEMSSSIYAIDADEDGHDIEGAAAAINDAINDRIDAHTLTMRQRAAIEAAHRVKIAKA